MNDFNFNGRTIRVRPLSDFHRGLMLAAMRRFQATRAPIEARTVIVLAFTLGLESISNFDLKFNENGQLTYDSFELVMSSFDQEFREELLERIWFASFGKPADLQLVSGRAH